MAKFLKNNTGSDGSWNGQDIANGAYYQIQITEMDGWMSNEDVITDIGSGDLIVARDDSGNTDYANPADGMVYFLDADPTPRDSENSPIQRTKTTKTGWHYEPRCLDFFSSKYKSLYNRKHDGNGMDDGTDYGDAALHFFNVSGIELIYQQTGFESETETEFQIRLNSGCVRTHMDWQPAYDMDIIGGIMMVKNPPNERAYMWTVVAPDIAEGSGGSIPHVAGGWNLEFFAANDKIQIDGRGIKTILNDPVYNSNKFRTIIKHAAGAQIGIQIVYEKFKG